MRKPSPEELRQALGSFVDIDPTPAMQVLDRTTIQLAGTCPFLCAASLAGKLNIGQIAHVGEEVHQAFGRATRAYIDCDGDIYAGQLKDRLLDELAACRPDLQPEVTAAAQAAAWAWAIYLKHDAMGDEPLNPANIMAFDGGEDIGKGGQLACDFEDLRVTVTSEVDFLHGGKSPRLLDEIDYKSGWKRHTERSVATDFQFRLHALLGFANFPDCEGYQVSVWNSRFNRPTFPVLFDRKKDLPRITAQVRMAIQHYMTSVLPFDIDDPQNLPPTWPTAEKCQGCDAAFLCPAAGAPIADVAKDPVAALRQLVVIDERRDKLAKALAAHVKTHGDVADGPVRFGFDKPKSERKIASVYELKPTKETPTNGSDGD